MKKKIQKNKSSQRLCSTFLIAVALFVVCILPQASALNWNDGSVVSYYKLDGTTGAVKDELDLNNGTSNGVTRGANGIINTAFRFDGVNDYANLTDIDFFTSNGAAISLWFNWNGTTASQIWSQFPLNGDRVGCDVSGSTLRCWVGDDSSGNWRTIGTVVVGEWNHLVMNHDTLNNNTFYLNNTLKYSEVYDYSNNGYDFLLGTLRLADTQPYNGTIDEVGIWNKTLSTTEISDLYNSGSGFPFSLFRNVSIELNTPVNGLSTPNNSIAFNSSVTLNNNNLSITNVSLLVDGIIVQTNTSGISGDYIFTESLSTGNHNWSILAFTNNSQNYTSANRTIETGDFLFGLCNSTLNNSYLNITFRDEGDNSILNASIPTSTFLYNVLGQSTVKTLTFTNTSNNYNYTFCSSRDNVTLQIDPYVQFKQGTLYPQRIWNPAIANYNNTITTQILYLLSSIDGIYVTFQVINPADQVLSGVDVTAVRTIGGVNVTVGTGTTDDAGALTIWANPDFDHWFSFVKTGFTTYNTIFAPTQTSYTITMGEITADEKEDYYQGISIGITPTSLSLVNNTEYDFEFTLASSFWDVSEFGFILVNSSGTEIGSTSEVTSGGIASLTLDTGNNTQITMKYYWIINGTYTNGTSQVWYITDTELSQFSIKQFFTDLTTYIDSDLFGLDNFGLSIILFILIFVTTGMASAKFGLGNIASISVFVFTLILFLDVGLGLMDNLNPIDAIPHFITVFTGIIMAGLLFREIR